jgi:hypothetical protein
VLARIHFFMCLGYAPLGADHVSDAPRVLGRAVVARTVSNAYLSCCVAEQREREVEFFGEGPVLFFGVEADAKDLCALVGELLDSVTESNPFNRSAGRVGFRIKPQHNGAALKIREPHLFARVRSCGKVGRLVSCF